MRKRGTLLCVCLLFALLLAACAPQHADYLDVFRGDFEGEVQGELHGMDFAAGVQATNSGAGREVVLTFYAPDTLSGVSVRQDAAGEVTVQSGGVSTPDSTGHFAPLLELFPTSGEVRRAEVTAEGRTRIEGEGFVIELLSDGTPYSVENSACCARVVSFRAK